MKIKIEWKDATETKLSLGDDVRMVPPAPGTPRMEFWRDKELIAVVDAQQARMWTKE